MDDQYTRISKNDEGNIGGTLSNLDADANPEEAVDELSRHEEEKVPVIMGFGEVLQQVDEQNTTLRVPHVRIEEIPVARLGSSRGRPNSPSAKKSAIR